MIEHISDISNRSHNYSVFNISNEYKNNRIVVFDESGECVNTKKYKLDDEFELTLLDILEHL